MQTAEREIHQCISCVEILKEKERLNNVDMTYQFIFGRNV